MQHSNNDQLSLPPPNTLLIFLFALCRSPFFFLPDSPLAFSSAGFDFGFGAGFESSLSSAIAPSSNFSMCLRMTERVFSMSSSFDLAGLALSADALWRWRRARVVDRESIGRAARDGEKDDTPVPVATTATKRNATFDPVRIVCLLYSLNLFSLPLRVLFKHPTPRYTDRVAGNVLRVTDRFFMLRFVCSRDGRQGATAQNSGE